MSVENQSIKKTHLSWSEGIAFMRQNADQAAISSFQASMCDPSDIAARERSENCGQYDLNKLPKDKEKRITALRDAIRKQKAELIRDCNHYNDLRTRGIDVISDFDLGMAYGRCDPLIVLKSTVNFKINHISYGRAVLAVLEEELSALTYVEPELQMDLFNC